MLSSHKTIKTSPLGVKCLVVACINFLLKSSLDNFIRAHIIAAKYGPKADVKTRKRDAKQIKYATTFQLKKPFHFLQLRTCLTCFYTFPF